jgi:hypothetical protein
MNDEAPNKLDDRTMARYVHYTAFNMMQLAQETHSTVGFLTGLAQTLAVFMQEPLRKGMDPDAFWKDMRGHTESFAQQLHEHQQASAKVKAALEALGCFAVRLRDEDDDEDDTHRH